MTGEKGGPKKGLRELGIFGLKRRPSRQQSLGIQRAAGNRKARIAFLCHTGGDKQPDEVPGKWQCCSHQSIFKTKFWQPSLGTQIWLIRGQPWGRG